jgi:putative membrane protein
MLDSITPVLAQFGGWPARDLGEALLHTAIFGLVGIIIVFIGLKIFDKALTGIDLEKEVAKGNIAAGILSGATIVALAIIIAAAMS